MADEKDLTDRLADVVGDIFPEMKPELEKLKRTEPRLNISMDDVYRYDSKTGVLQIAAAPSNVAQLVAHIDSMIIRPKNLYLPGIPGYFPEFRFKGVKRIEPMPGMTEDCYLVTLVRKAKPA